MDVSFGRGRRRGAAARGRHKAPADVEEPDRTVIQVGWFVLIAAGPVVRIPPAAVGAKHQYTDQQHQSHDHKDTGDGHALTALFGALVRVDGREIAGGIVDLQGDLVAVAEVRGGHKNLIIGHLIAASA